MSVVLRRIAGPVCLIATPGVPSPPQTRIDAFRLTPRPALPRPPVMRAAIDMLHLQSYSATIFTPHMKGSQ